MIDKNYINPFHDLLDEYSKATELKLRLELEKNIKNHIKTSTKRVTYLKDEEIIYLNTDNQFKIVRLIEFTKSYFEKSGEALEYYSFHSPNDLASDYARDYEVRMDTIKKVKKSYEKNKQDYLNLKTDFLLKDLMNQVIK